MGRRVEIDASTVLIRAGKVLDTLHIVLDGTLIVTVPGAKNNPGYGRRIYSKAQPLDEAVEYRDELDSSVLERIAVARTRFDWMLGRLINASV